MNYQDQNGIRSYRVSYPQGVQGSLTSNEIERISRLIRDRLDHSLESGFTVAADTHVTFVYRGSMSSYRYNITKSMNSFLIRDFADFVDLYQSFTDIHLVPNEDYVYEIIEIRIKVVRPPDGGCVSREKSEKITKGGKEKHLKSTNNNCFFRCLEKVLPGFNHTIILCCAIQ